MRFSHLQFLIKFAFKNILRNKTRSFLIGFSVAISVTLAVWVMSIFDGMNKQMVDAVIQCNVGNFQIQEENFSSKNDPNTPLPDSQVFYENLRNTKGILGVSRELVLEGFINAPEGSQSVNLLGVTPSEIDSVIPLKKNIISGKFLDEIDTDENQAQILIGESLRKKLNFHLGDKIVFNYQDVGGNLRSELMPIAGIYKLNGKPFEKSTIYVHSQRVRRLMATEGQPALTGIHRYIISSERNMDGEILDKIKPAHTILKSWKDINPEMGIVMEFNTGLVDFFLIIVGLCISVTILTPISMVWQERVKELETMHIIGLTRSRLWKLGLFEATIMSFCSMIVAIILIAIMLYLENRSGVDLSHMRHNTEEVERAGIILPQVIFPIITLKQIIVSIGFVMGAVFLSYILAIKNAIKQIRYF